MAIRLGSRLRAGEHKQIDPFTDLLFNTLLGFAFLFFVAIIFVNPTDQTAKIELDAEYVITVTWADNNPDDIDTWVRDPIGNVIWFRNRDVGLVHLDRDDRGMLDDTILVDGENINNPLNQEVVAIRRFIPGEYTVNIHYYESESKQPVTVTVRVAKVRPHYLVAFSDTIVLSKKGAEKTAVNFTLASDGSIYKIDREQKKLVSF